MSIIKINRAAINQSAALLADAIDKEFDTVIVIGFKDGQLMIKSSFSQDFLKIVGILAAKAHILAGE